MKSFDVEQYARVAGQVTYIQRVNTTGGLAPSEPGLLEGETKEVPYTAEYYFYKLRTRKAIDGFAAV